MIAFLHGGELPLPGELFPDGEELLNRVRQRSIPDEWRHFECEICVDQETGGRYVFVGGDQEWKAHLRSRRHKRTEKRMKREMEWEQWKALHGGKPSEIAGK